MTESSLSIVMPVHDKADSLARVLKALEAQRPAPDGVELVLVLDSCSDESAAIARRSPVRRLMPMVELDVAVRSPAAARNRGAEAASGRRLLFLDADIILPTNHLRALQAGLDAAADTVALTPLHANGVSASLLPYLADLPADWPDTENGALLRWAATQPALDDLRTRQADLGSGMLSRLAFPWAFGWSSAFAMRRELFDAAGGFDVSLKGRGSEDLALSRRLWKLGAGFRMLIDAAAFHWPHDRDRRSEVERDRSHERQLLAAFPEPDVELLAAFDGEHLNPMNELLEQRLPSRALTALAQRFAEPLPAAPGLPGEAQLVVGLPRGVGIAGRVHCWPGQGPAGEREAEDLAIHGFALPFEDAAVDSVIVAGLWELLPPSLTSRMLGEAKRVGRKVWLIRRADGRAVAPSWPAERLAWLDRPYWESRFPVSRDLWDHPAAPASEAGPYLVYRLQGAGG